MKKTVKSIVALMLSLCMVLSIAPTAFAEEGVSVDAEDAIEAVTTICYSGVDGPRVQAIVVEYNTEIDADAVSTSTYEALTYVNGLDPVYDIGSDNGGTIYGEEAIPATFSYKNGTPGEVTAVYVSDDPESLQAAETGKYVIVEINNDYMLSAACSSWRACVAGGVKQVKDIVTNGTEIKASDEEFGNYEVSYAWDINPHNSNHSVTLYMCMDDDLFTFDDIADYDIYITEHTDEVTDAHHTADESKVQYGDHDVDYKEATTTITGQIAGEGFKATNCYSEYDGEYHDVDLTYSLYVPDDYDPDGNYGLVLHIIDAGALGTDPVTALTECQAAANYASDEVQGYAKAAGLDGLIVVMPYMTKDDQTVADNFTGNQFIPAVWQLMDYLTDEYAIDTDRIYGSGQSMGGMQVLYMASQRDNYFAGIWSIGSQWGSNYNKEEVYGMGFNAHAYYTFPSDEEFITNEDWQNWYYSVSDDNILITNMTGDASSTNYWQLAVDIFEEYGDDVEIPYALVESASTTGDEKSDVLKNAVLSQDNNTGIYWLAMTDGNHKATWLYAHSILAGYEWLVNQNKKTEDSRDKIEALAEVTNGYSADTSVMPEPTEDAIEGIETIGFVDADGAKVSAIVVEYNEEIPADQVSADTYDVWTYWQDGTIELGENPGSITNVYVNTEAEMTDEPAEAGKYVIIELNTDFQGSRSATYYIAMAASVTQVKGIQTADTYIAASDTEIRNFETVTYEDKKPSGDVEIKTENRAIAGTYTIADIDKYVIDVYPAKDCFEEETGEYIDVDLDYALFVPADYDEDEEYMLVLHIEDAGALSNDANYVLTEAQTPVNLASGEIQAYAKEQGYGGVIVVCPQLTEELRSARDNYTVSAALQATWQLLDWVTATYNIDMDRIYGTGQSMGGMQVMEMAAMRDNYFAAIMPVGCQWGSNYNKEAAYKGAEYYATPVDGVYVWDTDCDGNPCDYQNWYYMLSDDNILCINCKGDSFSSTVWKELKYLYLDLADAEIPYTDWNPLTTSVEDQNEALHALLQQENELGIYWAAFDGGNHMATWVYADKIDEIYYWLLSQKASDEDARGKLEVLANVWAEADEQIQTSERCYATVDGVDYYFKTGKKGAGTAGYNSGWYNMNGGAPVAEPGWLNGVTIVIQPENSYAAAGEKATLSVGATGEGLTYQWEYTTDYGETWITCTSSASKKATFSFKMYKNFSGRIYRCVVTDEDGNKAVSEEVLVSIPFEITQQPEDVSAAVGEKAVLSVAAKGESLSYQWEYSIDDGETWITCSSAASRKAAFSFKMYKNFRGRIYRCVVTDAAENVLISETASLN